jgi:hypothetical protein
METIKLIIYVGVRDMSKFSSSGDIIDRTLLPIDMECYLEDMSCSISLKSRYPDLEEEFDTLCDELTEWFRSLETYPKAVLEFKQGLLSQLPEYNFVLELRGSIEKEDWRWLEHPRMNLEGLSPLEFVKSLVTLSEGLKLELNGNDIL